MAEETSPDIQNIGIQIGENAAVGGPVSGRDNINAGGHVIQAGPGSTVNIINPDPASLQAASRGLAALTELMGSDEVLRAVTVFQTDFERVRSQLDKVRDYKKLHDRLHKLQFEYSSIVEVVTELPESERAVEKLSAHHIHFEGLVEDIREIAKQPSLASQDTSWIGKLARACDTMGGAIEPLDMEKLNQVNWQLKRVLGKEPWKINNGLVDAARSLQLLALIQALAQLRDGLPAAGLDPEKVKQFEVGLEGLNQINQSLSSLVFQHDRWQRIELDLQQVEDSLEQDLTDLERAWPDLKEDVSQLLENGAEEWAKGLHSDADKLDQARIGQNAGKMKQHFRNFRSRAGRRFYHIDDNLKDLCERLREVGAPLASVLRMIG